MKNVLILHGTKGNNKENWFNWLKIELEKNKWKVWVPNLPKANVPNIDKYNKFIFDNKQWNFNEKSVIVGHSSGAVAILGLLQAIPESTKVDTCFLIGAFKNDLGWDSLKDLFVKPLNYELIKSKAKRFVFIHSDNDPYCPLDHAEYLTEKLGGDLIVRKGQKHFSVGTYGEYYKKFPFLLNLINS